MTLEDNSLEEIEKWMSDLVPIERNETMSWPMYDEVMEQHFKWLINRVKSLEASLASTEAELEKERERGKRLREACKCIGRMPEMYSTGNEEIRDKIEAVLKEG